MERIRPLSQIEQAFTLSNETYPLSVVCVLKLEKTPLPEVVKSALAALQTRHVLLRAGISQKGNQYTFVALHPVHAIPFFQEERITPDHWEVVTTIALNTQFEIAGPLMKCWSVSTRQIDQCELIVAFHHSIIDGHAARLLLHELLSLIGEVPLPDISTESPRVAMLPPAFRGRRLAAKLLPFSLREMIAEFEYRIQGQRSPIPPSAENAIITLKLPADISRRIMYQAGRKGLELNSILSAAIVSATWKKRYPDSRNGKARIIGFVDLRRMIQPEPLDHELGCHISMLRMSIAMEQTSTVWEIAGEIRRKIFAARRRGDVMIMAYISKALIRFALRMKNMRLGTSALSFIGKLDLERQYGAYPLEDVKAFITNNQFGPEFSGFGKMMFGRIELDFTYLSSEMTKEEAEALVAAIRDTLENVAEMP